MSLTRKWLRLLAWSSTLASSCSLRQRRMALWRCSTLMPLELLTRLGQTLLVWHAHQQHAYDAQLLPSALDSGLQSTCAKQQTSSSILDS